MKVFVSHVRPAVYGDVTLHTASCADTATHLSGVFLHYAREGRDGKTFWVAEMARSAALDGKEGGGGIVADAQKALSSFWKAVGPFSKNCSQISPAFWTRRHCVCRALRSCCSCAVWACWTDLCLRPSLSVGRSCKMARQHAQQALFWTSCCPVARISHGTEDPNCWNVWWNYGRNVLASYLESRGTCLWCRKTEQRTRWACVL